MNFKVIFKDGKFVKVLYNGSFAHSDSTARFIVWRNETPYTETEKTVSTTETVYTVKVVY